MRFTSWLRTQFPASSRRSRKASRQIQNQQTRRAKPALERLEDRLAPSAGQLDPTFGVGGMVNANIGGPTPTTSRAVVVSQPDGKVIIAGMNSDSSSGSTHLDIARFNTNGSLDNTFGSRGIVTFNFTTAANYYNTDNVASMIIDSSGHIIVAGTVDTRDSGNEFAVARLNSDGSFDSSFGTGGEVFLPHFIYSNENDSASGVALDSSGRIVVAGTANSSNFALARLNADGSLDTSFGNGGEAVVPQFSNFFYQNDTLAGVALDSSGQIVLVGTANGYSSSSFTNTSLIAIARLHSDASLDGSFGSGGQVLLPHFSDYYYASEIASGVALDSSGHIVVAGSSYGFFSDNYGNRTVAARLNNDGSLDSSFGAGGETAVTQFGPVGGYENDYDAGVALDSSGGIVLAGTAGAYFSANYSSLFAVTRLNSDGSLDANFGVSGQALVPQFGSSATESDSAVAEGLDSSGNIIVTGTADNSLIAVTRLNATGALDAGWGHAGQVTAGVTGPSNDQASDMTITQPDGKIILVGTSQAPGAYVGRPVVTRFNPDGSLDSTFGSGGTSFYANNSNVSLAPVAATVDSQGHIIIAGTFSDYLGNRLAVVRLNADGSLDTSFGNGGETVIGPFGDSPYETDYAPSVTVDASGRIVVAGTLNGSVSGNFAQYFAIARLTSAGNLDSTFGNAGQLTVSFGSNGEQDNPKGVAVDASGRIVVAGLAYNNSTGLQSVVTTTSPYFSANRLNGNYFLIGSGPNRTVFNDYNAGRIACGTGADLIFASPLDKVAGLTSSDTEFIIGS
ncbi:MAG: hypothetical protein ACJ8FY_22910 [Gemmataceae bacterium]